HIEIVRRYVRNIDSLRLRAASQRDPIVMICKYSGEGVVLLAQIAIVEIRERRSRREVTFPPLQAYEFARIPCARNRTQHGAVHPAEHGAVGANSNGQHRGRGDRKTGALAQLPQGKANILKQSCHYNLLDDRCSLLLGMRARFNSSHALCQSPFKDKRLPISNIACTGASIPARLLSICGPACPFSDSSPEGDSALITTAD